MIKNGDYAAAYSQLRECYGYKDSAALLRDFYILYDERTFTEYDKDGNVTLTGKFEYDQYGNTTSTIGYDATGAVTFKSTSEYKYDQHGYKIFYALYKENGDLDYKIDFTRDQNGIVTSEVETYKDGTTKTRKYEYQYDAEGNVVHELVRHSNGDADWAFEYKYDKYGNRTFYVLHSSEGDLKYKTTWEYEYDQNGRKTLEIEYDEDGNMAKKEEYEYDQYGKKILEKEYDADGILEAVIKFEYNEYGNRTLETEYDAEGNVLSKCEYEYVNLRVEYHSKDN